GRSEVRHRRGQLAAEQLAVHEPQEDLPAAVLRDPLQQLEAGARLVRARRLRQEERDVGARRTFVYAGRRRIERSLAGPELESRLPARVGGCRRELRAFLCQRLVDDDEHALARFPSGRPDELLAPAWLRETTHAAIGA